MFNKSYIKLRQEFPVNNLRFQPEEKKANKTCTPWGLTNLCTTWRTPYRVPSLISFPTSGFTGGYAQFIPSGYKVHTNITFLTPGVWAMAGFSV